LINTRSTISRLIRSGTSIIITFTLSGNWGNSEQRGILGKISTQTFTYKTLFGILRLRVHITWDENVNPYLTCLVWQIVKVKEGDLVIQEIRQIDEFVYEDPINKVDIFAPPSKEVPQKRRCRNYLFTAIVLRSRVNDKRERARTFLQI